MLRKQYEAMSQELKEATQEAEVAKCRRDWAFQERDKIVAERESIRSACARVFVTLWEPFKAIFPRMYYFVVANRNQGGLVPVRVCIFKPLINF